MSEKIDQDFFDILYVTIILHYFYVYTSANDCLLVYNLCKDDNYARILNTDAMNAWPQAVECIDHTQVNDTCSGDCA